MLVDEFDDEKTLDEEEALSSDVSVEKELDTLQREGNMPLEQLLATFGYQDREATSDSEEEDEDGEGSDDDDDDETSSSPEEEEEAPPPPCPPAEPPSVPPAEGIRAKAKTPSPPVRSREHRSTAHLLRSVSHASETSNSDSDSDLLVEEYWRRNDKLSDLLGPAYSRVPHQTIQVGSEYQATIPVGLCKYDDAPAYENEDRLLWDPNKLSDGEVEDYLATAQDPPNNAILGINSLQHGNDVRDDEQALYLLLQCGHNVEEALRRRRMNPTVPSEMSLWSEEECRSFESGLRLYGKNFHLIQLHKVRTRSVGELVHFYYLWKKTERHDIFSSKVWLEKKKYNLHPGTTDYMDRFLDEQEGVRQCERPSSPSEAGRPRLLDVGHENGRGRPAFSVPRENGRESCERRPWIARGSSSDEDDLPLVATRPPPSKPLPPERGASVPAEASGRADE